MVESISCARPTTSRVRGRLAMRSRRLLTRAEARNVCCSIFFSSLYFGSSGPTSLRRSCAYEEMPVSGVFTSCATPAARRPREARRSLSCSSRSSRTRSVTSPITSTHAPSATSPALSALDVTVTSFSTPCRLMKFVARQRLFAALRAEEEKTLELAAIAQGKDVAISGAKKFPRNVAGVRKSRIGEDERRRAEIAEVALGRPSRHILFRLIDEQRSAFAREEIHLLDVQCRAEPFAHHRDQLVHIVECRQFLREVGHRAAMSIAVAIEHALDH